MCLSSARERENHRHSSFLISIVQNVQISSFSRKKPILMHLSQKQRQMNQTFTILTNKYCSSDNDLEAEQTNCIEEKISQLPSTSNENRFCTFTKCKIKERSTINQNQTRYFDSPTMITLDDDDENDIPISRCSNKTSVTNAAEPSLNETDLSDLLIFTNRKFDITSISTKSPFCSQQIVF